jgi:hypothetical protein
LRNEEFVIPLRGGYDKQEYFQLFDNDCRVLLAHLRAKLEEVVKNESEDCFIDPLLSLKKQQCYASLEGNELKVQLPFVWHTDLDAEQDDEPSIEVTLLLAREKEKMFAAVGDTEVVELSPVCLTWVVNWLKDVLQAA